MKQKGAVCSPGPALLFFVFRFENLISGPKSYRDFRETDPRADLCWHYRRSWGFIRALNLSDADVDDNGENDEGFEDEDYDWLLCLINWHLSDQALGIEYIK